MLAKHKNVFIYWYISMHLDYILIHYITWNRIPRSKIQNITDTWWLMIKWYDDTWQAYTACHYSFSPISRIRKFQWCVCMCLWIRIGPFYPWDLILYHRIDIFCGKFISMDIFFFVLVENRRAPKESKWSMPNRFLILGFYTKFPWRIV